jgi:Type-1V conjugative transfer system mating pair stabilisation
MRIASQIRAVVQMVILSSILSSCGIYPWGSTPIESEHARMGLEEKAGREGLERKAIPSRDGSAIKIFEGLARHCSKKPTDYTNCCGDNPKGWGESLEANCTKEECALSEARSKNLCVYVGKTSNKTAGVTKHHYCCFGNILEKTIQVEGRKQLGLNFGSGGNANCRGLTPEEIARIDFSKIDFSEITAEMQKKMVMPNIGDAEGRIRESIEIEKGVSSK